MRKVGIIVAMEKEYYGLLGKEHWGKDETNTGIPFSILVSGIGKVNAAVAAYHLCRQRVTDILSFGCAGSAREEIGVGTVVVGTSFLYGDVWCGIPNAVGQVQGEPPVFRSLNSKWRKIAGDYTEGTISTSDTLVDTKFLAQSILVSNPSAEPVAFDMESAAIAQVCHHFGANFCSIRVISDCPLTGNGAKQYADFWERKDETMKSIFDNFMNYDYEEDKIFSY